MFAVSALVTLTALVVIFSVSYVQVLPPMLRTNVFSFVLFVAPSKLSDEGWAVARGFHHQLLTRFYGASAAEADVALSHADERRALLRRSSKLTDDERNRLDEVRQAYGRAVGEIV